MQLNRNFRSPTSKTPKLQEFSAKTPTQLSKKIIPTVDLIDGVDTLRSFQNSLTLDSIQKKKSQAYDDGMMNTGTKYFWGAYHSFGLKMIRHELGHLQASSALGYSASMHLSDSLGLGKSSQLSLNNYAENIIAFPFPPNIGKYQVTSSLNPAELDEGIHIAASGMNQNTKYASQLVSNAWSGKPFNAMDKADYFASKTDTIFYALNNLGDYPLYEISLGINTAGSEDISGLASRYQAANIDVAPEDILGLSLLSTLISNGTLSSISGKTDSMLTVGPLFWPEFSYYLEESGPSINILSGIRLSNKWTLLGSWEKPIRPAKTDKRNSPNYISRNGTVDNSEIMFGGIYSYKHDVKVQTSVTTSKDAYYLKTGLSSPFFSGRVNLQTSYSSGKRLLHQTAAAKRDFQMGGVSTTVMAQIDF
jgi:hypothetical protein